MAKVLLTGSAGALGTTLSDRLPALGHEVVGLDLPGQGADLSVDCTDPVAVDEAVAEVRPDAVIHLAGIPTESSLPDALSSHVLTTGALLEAMRRHGVPRIVYASSNHAVGRLPRSVLLGADTNARPDTHYGVGKVAAEALLHLYVDRYGIDAVSTRIGSFLERPTTRRQLSTWLSPDDTVRMFDAALKAPSPGFAVIYGISANTRGWWDLAPGRALGYDPQDDAETYAAEVEAEPETEVDRAEGAHVGGPFATEEYERPPFD
ncbi:NAD(P)-dependent oxidoreductase [Marmoricola sp. URHB0036]|uniref:NAD-dependent epimerase/dehydratase family protein n=1 Tax=Marmoricola sp. URHB0036 TaxID=1298863 RepID=UPI00042688B2|nr:NAD(P)-dependent oxidoreductase [Marmoricola sp. URHB0036]